MLSRVLTLLTFAFALAVITTSSLLAHERSHGGTIVKVATGKLTIRMADQKGANNERTMDVAANATITVDEKPGKLEDLKEGYHVKVTNDAKHVITKVEARSKYAASAVVDHNGTETTLKGTILCAMCALKEAKECQTAIQVKEGAKTVTYYLDDKGTNEEHHEPVCGGERKEGTVTGKVQERDGKKYIKPSKVVYAK